MFEIKHTIGSEVVFISNEKMSYLHSDGSIYDVAEFFPSKEIAQKVLDKFYPKPEHVWEHGDVFESGHPINSGTMMYIRLNEGNKKCQPQVVYVNQDTYSYSSPEAYLNGAKFLFNIREKI